MFQIMKIVLSNIIEIQKPNKDILEYCKKELTIKNPDYDKKKRMGFSIYKTPKTIKLYDLYNENLYLPIGCFDDIWKIHPVKEDYTDYSNVVNRKIKSNITLRDYQVPCAKALKKYVNGIFVLPAGTGKTQVGLECASVLGQHTLWLTHTKELLNQAKERCENNLVCSTSVISDGKCDTSGDIVFATVQTLANIVDKETIKQNEFGLIIIDECHHLATNAESVMMFEKCVNYFCARYKLGLTATLHRADGLEKTTTKILGNVIYELKKNDTKDKLIGYYEGKAIVEVPAYLFQVPANINVIHTGYNTENKDVFDINGGTIVFTKLITDLAMNNKRNKLILDISNMLDGYTIIISERVDQLHYLDSKLPSSVCIDSKLSKKKREQLVEDFKSGKHKVLLASYSLVAEGLDVPMLENIIMASPVKDERLVIQSIGRCQRPYKDKKIANVYDLVDDVSVLGRFLTKRKSVYKKEGWKVR